MKKGKRQVNERQSCTSDFANDKSGVDAAQSNGNGSYFDSFSSNQQTESVSTAHTTNNQNNNLPKKSYHQPQTQSMTISQSPQQSQKTQPLSATTQMDQKKRKIELLKQKYLKKSASTVPKAQQTKVQKIQQRQNSVHQQQPHLASTTEVPEIPAKEQVARQNIQKQQKKNGNQNMNANQQHNYHHATEEQAQIEIEKETEIKNKNPEVNCIQGENTKSATCSQSTQAPQKLKSKPQLRAPAARLPGAPPPPPPSKKRPLVASQTQPRPVEVSSPSNPISINNSQINSTQEQQQPQQQQDQQQQPFKEKESSHPKASSPSFTPAPIKEIHDNGNPILKKAPPPPSNKNMMKTLLNKKLNKQLKSPASLPNRPVAREMLNNNNDDDDDVCNGIQQEAYDDFNNVKKTNSKIKQKNYQSFQLNQNTIENDDQGEYQDRYQQDGNMNDEQYKESHSTVIGAVNSQSQQSRSHQSNTKQSQSQLSLEKLIKEWIGSPQITLCEMHPQEKLVIEFYCMKKNANLILQSKHPHYCSVIQEIVHQFLINNTTRYTQSQSQSAQTLCLTYFNGNANSFSDVFLLCLVKMGRPHLLKYRDALQEKLSQYLSRLIMLRNLLLDQEVSEFIDFCLEASTPSSPASFIKGALIYKLIMLAPSHNPPTKLLEYANSFQFSDYRDSISILCLCKLGRPELMSLYLRLLSSMSGLFIQYGQVESVLNHLKQLNIPADFYQLAKQIRIKMLKGYEDQKSGGETLNGNNNGRARQQQQMNNGFMYNENGNENGNVNGHNVNGQQGQQQKSLFGYFNLNKAIDKIKTSTSNVITVVNNNREKPPKQEQIREEKIAYDPIKKRYLINGKIPDEESEEGQQAQEAIKPKKAPPPPPPLGGKSRVPPAQGKRGPPKINRYT